MMRKAARRGLLPTLSIPYHPMQGNKRLSCEYYPVLQSTEPLISHIFFFRNNESQEGKLCDRRGTTLSSDTEDESHLLGQETQAFLETNRRLVNEVLTFEKDFKPALAKVATRYRFLQDEVEGMFQELGQDLQATEQHFKEIREYIVHKRAHEITDALRQ